MFPTKSISKFLVLSGSILFTSCVKDIDLERIDEVVIPPTAAIDLVYFTLEAEDFQVSSGAPPYKTEDIVDLQFLDDEYIQTGLVGASFSFKYINTFPKKFINTVSFLSKNGTVKYVFNFEIPSGSTEDPAVINYTEIIPKDQIQSVRASYNLRIQIEMVPSPQPVTGSLQLKSKAFYEFEF